MESRKSFIDTDIQLVKAYISNIENIMMPRMKCKTTLKNFHKKNGKYEFVIIRDLDDNNNLILCIGKGSHYNISHGAKSVVIAGEIEFLNKNVDHINDQSGTYHLNFIDITQEQKIRIYLAQKKAMEQVGFPRNVIDKLERPYDSDHIPDEYKSSCNRCCYNVKISLNGIFRIEKTHNVVNTEKGINRSNAL